MTTKPMLYIQMDTTPFANSVGTEMTNELQQHMNNLYPLYDVIISELPLKPLTTVHVDDSAFPTNNGEVKTIEEKIEYCESIIKPKLESMMETNRFLVLPSTITLTS